MDDDKHRVPPFRALLGAESSVAMREGTDVTYSRRDLNKTIVTVADMTETAAVAYLGMERARAEAERHRADAERCKADALVRVAEEETKREEQITAQAREGTVQSSHKMWRVIVSCLTLAGGVVGCVLKPEAAPSIAGMVGGVLTIAVGGSYAVEAISKIRTNHTDRNAGTSQPGGTGR